MNPRIILRVLIGQGEPESRVLEEFKRYRFSIGAAKNAIAQCGVTFPMKRDYSDFNPSPERKGLLQELSLQ